MTSTCLRMLHLVTEITPGVVPAYQVKPDAPFDVLVAPQEGIVLTFPEAPPRKHGRVRQIIVKGLRSGCCLEGALHESAPRSLEPFASIDLVGNPEDGLWWLLEVALSESWVHPL